MPRHPPYALYSLILALLAKLLSHESLIHVLCVSAFAFVFTSFINYTFEIAAIAYYLLLLFFSLYLSPRIYYLLSLCSCQGTVVGSSGLEPPTSRVSGARSNQLSYEPSLLASSSAGSFAVRRTGGDERVRTAGLLLARQALYQLSYTPTLCSRFAFRCVVAFLLPISRFRHRLRRC